jgi:hypothetical protein
MDLTGFKTRPSIKRPKLNFPALIPESEAVDEIYSRDYKFSQRGVLMLPV